VIANDHQTNDGSFCHLPPHAEKAMASSLRLDLVSRMPGMKTDRTLLHGCFIKRLKTGLPGQTIIETTFGAYYDTSLY